MAAPSERGPEIDIRVGDAIELQVAQHRLGDEPEALRSPGKRRQHDDRRDDDVDPAGPRALEAGCSAAGAAAGIVDAVPMLTGGPGPIVPQRPIA